MRRSAWLVFLCSVFPKIASADSQDVSVFPAQTKHSANKFISVHAACSRQMLLAVVLLNEPFFGSVYSRGYPLECRVIGNGTRELRISIGVNECGTKVDKGEDGTLVFENYLYIQYDRQVQQSMDEQILIRCSPQDILVTGMMGSVPSRELMRVNRDDPETSSLIEDSRKLGGTIIKTSTTVESWMDIMKGSMPLVRPILLSVNTGDVITMIVKIRHKVGVETKVTSCFAHDGSKTMQQKLTDENGCSMDRSVMPDLQEKLSGPRGIKMVHSSFPAFKFPDKTSLHLQCKVIVCNYTCPVVSCRKPSKIRQGHAKYTSSLETKRSNIIEEINVFNSVEVKTPSTDNREPLRRAKTPRAAFSNGDDGESFLCLSSARLLLSGLGILSCLTILLVISICMCVRAHKLQKRLGQRIGIGLPYGRVMEYT